MRRSWKSSSSRLFAMVNKYSTVLYIASHGYICKGLHALSIKVKHLCITKLPVPKTDLLTRRIYSRQPKTLLTTPQNTMWTPWPGSRGSYAGARSTYRGPHDYNFPGRQQVLEDRWYPYSALNNRAAEFGYGGGWSGRYGQDWNDEAMGVYRQNGFYPNAAAPYYGGFR